MGNRANRFAHADASGSRGCRPYVGFLRAYDGAPAATNNNTNAAAPGGAHAPIRSDADPARLRVLRRDAGIGAATLSHPAGAFVVAFPAGGATDVIARAVSQRLSEMWGQPIVIENKGGAGTQIGAEYVGKQTGDGYTLLATSDATFAFNPSLYRKLAYDPNDFVPVSGLGIVNQVLVTSPGAPFRSVADLIAQAKAKPREINYGTMGAGTSGHINMAMFERMAGVALTPVHYRGGAPLSPICSAATCRPASSASRWSPSR